MTGSQASNAGGQVWNIGPGGNPVGWAAAAGEHYVFSHEIGHIFGCRHNRLRDPTGPYEHGYLMVGSTMRTLMA